MELFYSQQIEGDCVSLGPEESAHCVKVLRHREGDQINIIDGEGTLLSCRLVDASPKGASAVVLSKEENWGGHDYHLTMAVCPTKNNDRYEWFAEKATEMGLDSIAPIIGDHSERKVFKEERLQKILLSASKQSLKAKIPQIEPCRSVSDFIDSVSARPDALKLIAYCFEGEMPRQSVKQLLNDYQGREVIIMIGPEGDFSQAEAEKAIRSGFIPVHLGESRLRTETAALAGVAATYFRYM